MRPVRTRGLTSDPGTVPIFLKWILYQGLPVRIVGRGGGYEILLSYCHGFRPVRFPAIPTDVQPFVHTGGVVLSKGFQRIDPELILKLAERAGLLRASPEALALWGHHLVKASLSAYPRRFESNPLRGVSSALL